MREIKFRAWDGKKMRLAFDLTQNPRYWWEGNKDFPLMQYTGLKDKNGVEIYEGDVVLIHDKHGRWAVSVYYKPKWLTYFCLFTIEDTIKLFNKKSDFGYERPLRVFMDNIEVLGNVWENPELLEGNK